MNEGYLNTPRYKLYEKVMNFIDSNPNRVWDNGRKATGRSISGDVITIYFQYSEGEKQPTLNYEKFMEDNKLTEINLG